MKAGEPCRLCGVNVTEEVIKGKRERKSQKMREAKRLAKERGELVGVPRQYDYEKILKLRNQGFSIREIARLIHSSTRPVQHALSLHTKALPKGKH